jgi:GDP-L-fucose synthase
MDKTARIHVAGHRGMVGSAILRNLRGKGYFNIVVRSHHELPLDESYARKLVTA